LGFEKVARCFGNTWTNITIICIETISFKSLNYLYTPHLYTPQKMFREEYNIDSTKLLTLT